LKKKKKASTRPRRHHRRRDASDSSISTSSLSSVDHQWFDKRARDLERQRAELFEQWKAEVKAEEEAKKREKEQNKWYRRLFRFCNVKLGGLPSNAYTFLVWLESFIANLPLTIGAIALALANLGVVVSINCNMHVPYIFANQMF
jgi:hypothetical protein